MTLPACLTEEKIIKWDDPSLHLKLFALDIPETKIKSILSADHSIALHVVVVRFFYDTLLKIEP